MKQGNQSSSIIIEKLEEIVEPLDWLLDVSVVSDAGE